MVTININNAHLLTVTNAHCTNNWISSSGLQRHEIMRLSVSQNPVNLPELVTPGQIYYMYMYMQVYMYTAILNTVTMSYVYTYLWCHLL